MIGVDVRTNLDRTEASFTAWREGFRDKAIYRALNRALDQTATGANREIRKVYNVKAKAVSRAFRKFKANSNKLTAVLRIQGARIPLIEFAARWKPGQSVGATAKVMAAGGRETYPGTFIQASTRNNARGGGSAGQRQVFKRVGKSRYPILTQRGISIPQAFGDDAVTRAAKQIAAESFTKNFEQQVKFLSRG